jgi:hypothetical protein
MEKKASKQITVAECAELLGVSHPRVKQLLAQGRITGVKAPPVPGKSEKNLPWMVDVASAKAFAKIPRPLGGPIQAKGSK